MCDRTHRTHGPVGYVTLPGTHFLKKSAFMYYAVTVVGVFWLQGKGKQIGSVINSGNELWTQLWLF